MVWTVVLYTDDQSVSWWLWRQKLLLQATQLTKEHFIHAGRYDEEKILPWGESIPGSLGYWLNYSYLTTFMGNIFRYGGYLKN